MFFHVCGRSGSIPGADKLDSGFHLSGVGKMRSYKYVDGWPLQKTAELKRATVRWSRVSYAAGGEIYTTRGILAASAGTLEVLLQYIGYGASGVVL